MPAFEISYTEETWYRAIIEAKDEHEAQDKFWANNFDLTTIKQTGGEIQESIDIEELDIDEDLP